MKPEQRLFFLKIAVGAIVGLWILDAFIIEPAYRSWVAQGERITALKARVADGQKLLDREKTDRARWADMMHENLPQDPSKASDLADKAVGRWLRDNRVTFTSVAPVWKDHPEGYLTHEWQVEAFGDQASIGRFLFEMETDTVPVNMEKCEITTRDARGSMLTLSVHFSFLQIPPPKNTR